MPWYFFSLVGMLFAAGYALSQKWALNLKINIFKLLTYVFVGSFVCYAFYSFIILHGFNSLVGKLTSPINLLLALSIAALSFFGNIFYMHAVDKSPNPGYVEGINITNVLLVLIGSAIFLDAPISWLKAGGILVVLIGVFLLTVERGQTKSATGNWKPWAFAAMISFGLMFVVVKAMTNAGFAPEQVLTILFFFAGIGFLITNCLKRVGLRLGDTPRIVIIPIVLAILASFMDNLMQYIGIKLVPNPGYSTAVFYSSTVLILFLSPLVFPKEAGGEFNVKKWLGVIITIGGVLLVILG